MQFLEKSKYTQLEVTKGSIASLVLTQYCDFLENSLSCGTFGLLSVGTNSTEFYESTHSKVMNLDANLTGNILITLHNIRILSSKAKKNTIVGKKSHFRRTFFRFSAFEKIYIKKFFFSKNKVMAVILGKKSYSVTMEIP